MDRSLFGSDLWKPALDKYAGVTGLSVELFGVDAQVVFGSDHLAPLVALFREYGYEPGLFAGCARRSVAQTTDRPAVAIAESHGLMVVGTSLVLDGEIVGAAVAGYALASFVNETTLQRWAKSAAVPLDRLWSVARRQAPLPDRRLMLYGELLQVLGDALLRENHRTRQYEDAVEKLKAAAAAKDEFLAVLSHELRTPLAPIAGWASVLKKTQSLDHVHRGAEAIERNALLQSRMVDELLDMNRIAYGAVRLDLEILEVPALIRAAVEASAQDIEKKAIRLEVVDPGMPLQVEGDAGRLQQVFRNILDNAAKFTDAGGTIRVSLGREADSAVIIVANTGKGIAPEFLPFVFDIFRQQERGTHRSQEGLGIGLSLVKKLTELHKGTVSIASRGAGHGAEVTVRLPLATETVEAADTETVEAADSARRSAPALAGLSVLVVEDSEDTREALRSLLELLGAKVWVARDGREGLEMMLQGASADVVLCDLLMPRLDGFEFIREIRSRLLPAQPPVISMSGLATEASRARSSQAGFIGHIAKPFNEAAVVAAVQAAVEGRRAPQSTNFRSP